jgi:hypothetical protein
MPQNDPIPDELITSGEVAYWVIWPHPSGYGILVVPGLTSEDPAGAAMDYIPAWMNVHNRSWRHSTLEAATLWCQKRAAPQGYHVHDGAWKVLPNFTR